MKDLIGRALWRLLSGLGTAAVLAVAALWLGTEQGTVLVASACGFLFSFFLGPALVRLFLESFPQ